MEYIHKSSLGSRISREVMVKIMQQESKLYRFGLIPSTGYAATLVVVTWGQYGAEYVGVGPPHG